MYFRVKYKEIEETGNYFKNKSRELNTRANKVNSLLKELEKYWNGYDYNEYKNSYVDCIKETLLLSKEINDFGGALCKVSSIYYSANNNFEKKVSKMEIDDCEE